MKTFTEWLKEKSEAFLPPEAPPAAMVQPAPKHASAKFLGLRAQTNTQFQRFLDGIPEAEKKLDMLATVTNQHPRLWTMLHEKNPSLSGMTHQEQLESFINDYKLENKRILDNLQKYQERYQHGLDEYEAGRLTKDIKDMMLGFNTLFRITQSINMDLTGVSEFHDPQRDAVIIDALDKLDKTVFSSSIGYQKSIDLINTATK